MKKILLAALAAFALTACKNAPQPASSPSETSVPLTGIRFSGDSAYAAVQAQCDFGPRTPGSAAHARCADYIAARFAACGLEVTRQTATLTAWDGKKFENTNIIAAYRPEAEDRVVIAAHWDSRPWADADPDSTKHREPVLAANDGASGVAVMMELARHLAALKPAVGVDLVCFDLEDYGAPYWGTPDPEGKDWCLGSAYWAQQAAAGGYRARYGILLDMVGGKDARFCYEGMSMRYAENVMNRLWDTAERVGAGHLFVKTDGGWANDDHVPMNLVAGIPTVDVIPHVEGTENSFGWTWHTVSDTPENISAENLRLVGQTLLQLLAEEQ